MKEILFTVWFTSGRTRDIYAPGPLEACILVQAEAIKYGADFAVSSVQDQETGETFVIEDGKAHRTEMKGDEPNG